MNWRKSVQLAAIPSQPLGLGCVCCDAARGSRTSFVEDRRGGQVTDSTQDTPETAPRASLPRDVNRMFEQIEHWIAVGIGALLSLAAVLALLSAVALAWDGVLHWPQMRSLFAIVDQLLFVLMVIELLHTVRTSIQTHQLRSEPFLIVGMIATIRRILVVTLETSDQTSAGGAAAFDRAMLELAVLAVLTLVIAVALYLSRRTKQ
jgi:uncharacterized membrane protein (DUF373 family)